MAKYNNLEKILHRQFVGNSYLSKFLFNRLVKNSLYSNHHNLENHIFITGLARSGSTALLNKIFSPGELASITYKDMPFVLSPSLSKYYSYFSKKNDNLIERFHKDGIQINIDSPECLDEPFWLKSFPSCKDKLFQELVDIPEELLHCYSFLLHKHAKNKGFKRLVVKNNNNHQRLPFLSKKFPNGIFLLMIREPISHSFSLLKQHLNFLEIQRKDKFVLEYMNTLGHFEFGLNAKPFIYSSNLWYKDKNKLSFEYWISQWINTYEWIFESGILKNKNIFLISYEDLCVNKNVYKEICKLVNINNFESGIPFRLANKKYEENLPKLNEVYINYANDLYKKLRTMAFLN